MQSLYRLALLAIVLGATGCGDLLSLHALFTPTDKVFDTALEGTWVGEHDDLIVQREGDLYAVTTQSKKDPSDRARYEVHLVDLGGERFADVLWVDSIGHMFLRVRVADKQLHLAFLDSEWLRSQLPHEDADVDKGKKKAVLTADTAQLRRWVAKFAHEPKAYDQNELVYRRGSVAAVRSRQKDFVRVPPALAAEPQAVKPCPSTMRCV